MPVTPRNRKARAADRPSTSSRSIDPASSLLSPPNPKTTSVNPVHAFFTPRRNPLRKLAPSASNSRTRGLPSPEASPSHRSKRQRVARPLFGADEEPEFLKPQVDGHGIEEEEEPEIVLPALPKKIRSSFNSRILMRSLGGYGLGSRSAGYREHHCAGVFLSCHAVKCIFLLLT